MTGTVCYFWPEHSGIYMRGEQAEAFLQGLLSCDVSRCTTEYALPGALLSVNGRVISDFTLVRAAQHEWLLLPPPGQAQALIDELQRPAMLYRGMKFEPLQWHRQTLFSASDSDAWRTCSSPGCITVQLPGADGQSAVEHIRRQPLDAPAQNASAQDWIVHRLRSGALPVVAEIAGKFTAHALNMPSSGEVSLDKGCYRGQEIVARTHYRGKVKRALRVVQAAEPLAVGAPVCQGEQRLGEVVLSYPLPQGCIAVVQLPVDAQGDLSVDGVALD